MNLHTTPSNPGPGVAYCSWAEVLQDASQGPTAGQVSQGPGAAGNQEGGVPDTGETTARSVTDPRGRQPAPLCFYQPAAVPTWAKAPETHRPSVGLPAPSPAGALATDIGRMVTELRGKLQVLREHSENALWGHDPGRTTPPIADPSKVPLHPWTQGQ